MKLIALAILGFAISAFAQTEVVTTAAQTSKPTSSPKKKSRRHQQKSFGPESKNEGPITTEIYADEASFDSGKNVGVFTGHVKVFDPRFNLQSDKLTVYLHKGEDQGLEKAIAEGNVGVVRDRPDPNGGPPTHAVGRSEHRSLYCNRWQRRADRHAQSPAGTELAHCDQLRDGHGYRSGRTSQYPWPESDGNTPGTKRRKSGIAQSLAIPETMISATAAPSPLSAKTTVPPMFCPHASWSKFTVAAPSSMGSMLTSRLARSLACSGRTVQGRRRLSI
jgi:hypothetical protein